MSVPGLDYIGVTGCKNTAMKAHPRGWAFGALTEASGWKGGYKAIDDIITAKAVPCARIHLMWKDNHRFSRADIQETVIRAQKLARVIRKHPAVCWYVSPWLEPQGVSKQLYTEVITACKMSLPDSVIMVTSAWPSPVVIEGTITEMHHNFYRKVPGPSIFSYDGLECTDADMKKYQQKARNAQFFFYWRYTCNGKFGSKDQRKREDRDDYITPKEIRSIKQYEKKRGKVSLPSGWTWKTHGEGYDHYDPDENKAVLLTDRRFSKVYLRAKKKKILELRYSGMSHGKHVYRTNKWGIDIARLIKRTGKKLPTAAIVCDGDVKGRINVCWRAGTFRNQA